MCDEDDVNKYYNRFLDLANPLLNSYHLKDKECNILFWYGFHPEDCMMILSQFHPQQTRTYLHLKQVFCTACAIFLQRPSDLQKELQDALKEYPKLRRPHLDRHAQDHRPSISRYRTQDVMQELKDKVMCCRRQARKDKDRELEKLIHALYSFSIYQQQYAVLYR